MSDLGYSDDKPTKYFIEGQEPSQYFDFEFRADSSIDRRTIYVDVIDRLSKILGYSIVEKQQHVFRLEIVDSKKLKKIISHNQQQSPSVTFEEDSYIQVRNLTILDLVPILMQISSCVIETEGTNSIGYDLNIPVTKDLTQLSIFLKRYGIELGKTGKTIKTVHLVFNNNISNEIIKP